MFLLTALLLPLTAMAGPTSAPHLVELDWNECIEVDCHVSAVYPPVVTPTSYLGTLFHRGPAPRPASITTLCETEFGPGVQAEQVQIWVTPGVYSGACIPPDAPDPTDPTGPDPTDIDDAIDDLDAFERDMEDLFGGT